MICFVSPIRDGDYYKPSLFQKGPPPQTLATPVTVPAGQPSIIGPVRVDAETGNPMLRETPG